jgi:hypothetical protein
MADQAKPSRSALAEALALSEEILGNLELGDLALTSIAFKAGRLARLSNDFVFLRIMEYEAGGYPSDHDGVPPEIYEFAVLAGREFDQEEGKGATKTVKKLVYMESISQMEAQIQITDSALAAAVDPDVAVAPTNPFASTGNAFERGNIRTRHFEATTRLATSRALIYRYVLEKFYELKFSGIADDVFTRTRMRVDSSIGKAVPEAVKRLTAIYENLGSDNPEDWSNAVHGCRRILQDLADAIFPPSSEVRTKTRNGEERPIKLGKENYINRLIAFVEDRSESTTFTHIVGSQLAFLGDRLDAMFRAAQKGSHTDIIRREEADRCVVYTYLLAGDILSLLD